MVQSGSKGLEVNKKLSGCALVYLRESSTDIIGIKFEHNLSNKGVYLQPKLTFSDPNIFRGSVLFKRQALSFCNGIYDPLEWLHLIQLN